MIFQVDLHAKNVQGVWKRKKNNKKNTQRWCAADYTHTRLTSRGSGESGERNDMTAHIFHSPSWLLSAEVGEPIVAKQGTTFLRSKASSLRQQLSKPTQHKILYLGAFNQGCQTKTVFKCVKLVEI